MEEFICNCPQRLVILTISVSLLLNFLLLNLPPKRTRRKERRREERLCADKRAASDRESASEKDVTVLNDTLEVPEKENIEKSADKQAEELVSLKCDQCAHEANCKVSLVKHVM